VTSSHEQSEPITDPVPGEGWYDDLHARIGDICAWKMTKEGQYTVSWNGRIAQIDVHEVSALAPEPTRDSASLAPS